MVLNCGVGEDSWESPGLQGDETNQSWIFIGRTEPETETPILWPSDAKNWLIGKDPDAGKDWRQEKGTTEDEMVRWQDRLNHLSLSKLWEIVKGREAWCAAVRGVTKGQTWLSNWSNKQAPAVTANMEWYSLKKEQNTFQPWQRLYVPDSTEYIDRWPLGISF